jgi:DNA-binding NarL/FixJ family response regulator
VTRTERRSYYMTEEAAFPDRNSESSPTASKGQTRPIRIVIADDHPVFRDGLRKLLMLEEDFRVIAEARDGKEVLEVLEQHQPDILLLDLKMPPGLDGMVSLQKLQASRTTTKVIVLTASEQRAHFVRAMNLGACGIVRKQAATELLIKSIRTVHNGGTWFDSQMIKAKLRQSSSLPAPAKQGGRCGDAIQLSQRQREITSLIAQGLKNKQVADKMFISEQTVKNHLYTIFKKLGVSDRMDLALYAIRKKIRSPVRR